MHYLYTDVRINFALPSPALGVLDPTHRTFGHKPFSKAHLSIAQEVFLTRLFWRTRGVAASLPSECVGGSLFIFPGCIGHACFESTGAMVSTERRVAAAVFSMYLRHWLSETDSRGKCVNLTSPHVMRVAACIAAGTDDTRPPWPRAWDDSCRVGRKPPSVRAT